MFGCSVISKHCHLSLTGGSFRQTGPRRLIVKASESSLFIPHRPLFLAGCHSYITMPLGNKKRKRPTVQVVHDPDSGDEVEIGVSINPSQDTQALRSHRLHSTESMPLSKRTRAGPLHTSAGQIPCSLQASQMTPAEEKRRKQVNYMWLGQVLQLLIESYA